jgi:hypothetical protein
MEDDRWRRAVADVAQQSFKPRRSQRAKWLRREWETSQNGNAVINHGGFNVVVYRKGAAWAARFIDKITGYTRFSEHPHASEDAAKLAAFDAIAEYSESDACKSARRREIGEKVIIGYSSFGSPYYLLKDASAIEQFEREQRARAR